jgi:hypothetical protein
VSNEKVKPAEVVLRLKAGNAQKLLDAIPEALVGIASGEQRELREQLRAALDSLPVEERVEARVLTRFRNSEGTSSATHPSRIPLVLKRLQKKYPRAERRVQSRTITTFSDGSTLTSPWTDLPREEGERG